MMKKRRSEEALTDNVLLSSKQTNSEKYHIFLSFRGFDTRNNFTAHLYERLVTLGFNVYKDDKTMIKGEEINGDLKRAISNSRICIPIFSRTYASSKACLCELCYMIESKSKIIPIFYDVTPDDVKLKTSLYRSALQEHRHSSKIRLDEVDKWENALSIATEKAGFDIVDKNEAEEVTSITRELVNQLMPKYQDVTNHLVEIDTEMHCVETLLDFNSSGFRIIGVFGMGGIGKTTLTKLIFNRHCSKFPGCCSFLANVRENLESKRLLELQRQLYNDITSPSLASSITDANDGINKLKIALENKNVLLVLDDMDSASQLANLVGHHVSFASGSRVIITTRDKRTLDVLKQDMELHAYELKEMDYNRAIKLFSRNAFRSDFPPRKFQALSEEVVSYIKGLPLALEVFGSSLCGRSKEECKEKLEELKSIPDKGIQNRLMLSYQGLKSNQKKIFLDIACYRGELKKIHACYMWEDCGWFPKSVIQVLKDRSLIKVIAGDDEDSGGGEILWMHDLLKDLGRTIIQEESDKSSLIQNRLHINESLDILHENKGKKCVETLSISNATITRENMSGLCRLRFLELSCCTVVGDFEGLFPDLRWLSVRGFLIFEPINFKPKKLVVFSLSNWHNQQRFGEWSKIKADQLKVLDLDFCKYTWEMLFKKFSNLEVLVLKECNGLGGIATSSVELKSLTQLSMRKMSLYGSIDWIGKLTSLCKLNLSGLGITELPESIGHFKKLKELHVECYDLERVPELPTSLTHLYIKNEYNMMQVCWSSQFKMTNIIELELYCKFIYPLNIRKGNYLNFEWIGSATNLEKLCLDIPYTVTNLEKVAELPSLKHLNVKFAKFQYLQHFPSSLLHLGLDRCKLPGRILDVSNLMNLEILRILGDKKLEDIKGLGELHSRLELLDIRNCPSLECLPNISKSTKLRSLTLSCCDNLGNIPGLAELESLEEVLIYCCDSLELSPTDLSKLENAQNLNVYISSCEKLPFVNRFYLIDVDFGEFNVGEFLS